MAGYSTRKCTACGQTSKFRNDYMTCCKGTVKGVVVKPLNEQNKVDIELEKIRVKRSGDAERIKILSDRLVKLETEYESLLDFSNRTPQVMEVDSRSGGGKSESVAVMVWSDWHTEEEVLPGQVGNKNEHNLEI